MKRTQVYLTQNEHKALTQLSRSTKKKRSEIIREAIDEHIKKYSAENRRQVLGEIAGIWKDNDFDFEKLRKGWTRKF